MFYFFQTIGKNGMKLFTIALLCVSQILNRIIMIKLQLIRGFRFGFLL